MSFDTIAEFLSYVEPRIYNRGVQHFENGMVTRCRRVNCRHVGNAREARHQAEWKELVMDCHSSGMAVRAWCDKQQISYKTYYR